MDHNFNININKNRVNLYIKLQRELSQRHNITSFSFIKAETFTSFLNETIFALIVNYCIEHYRQPVIYFHAKESVFKPYIQKYTRLPPNLKFTSRNVKIIPAFVYKRNPGKIKILALVKFFVLFKKIQKWHATDVDYDNTTKANTATTSADTNTTNADAASAVIPNTTTNDDNYEVFYRVYYEDLILGIEGEGEEGFSDDDDDEENDTDTENFNGNNVLTFQEKQYLEEILNKHSRNAAYALQVSLEDGLLKDVTILMKYLLTVKIPAFEIGLPNEKNRKIWLRVIFDLFILDYSSHLFNLHRFIKFEDFFTYLYQLYVLLLNYNHNVSFFFRILRIYYKKLNYNTEKIFLYFFLKSFNLLPYEIRIPNTENICMIRDSSVLVTNISLLKNILDLVFLYNQYDDNRNKTLKAYFSKMKLYTSTYIVQYITYSCFNDRNIHLFEALCHSIPQNSPFWQYMQIEALLPKNGIVTAGDKYYFTYFIKLLKNAFKDNCIDLYILQKAEMYFETKLTIQDFLSGTTMTRLPVKRKLIFD